MNEDGSEKVLKALNWQAKKKVSQVGLLASILVPDLTNIARTMGMLFRMHSSLLSRIQWTLWDWRCETVPLHSQAALV